MAQYIQPKVVLNFNHSVYELVYKMKREQIGEMTQQERKLEKESRLRRMIEYNEKIENKNNIKIEIKILTRKIKKTMQLIRKEINTFLNMTTLKTFENELLILNNTYWYDYMYAQYK